MQVHTTVERPRSSPYVGTALSVCLAIGAFFGAKWNFANAVSSRTDQPDIAALASSLAPADPQTRFAYARLLESSFDPEAGQRALIEYEYAVAASPYNYLTWYQLGRARSRSGDMPGAETALTRALELAPNYAEVQWALGNHYLRTDRSGEGFALIRKAVSGRSAYAPSAASLALKFADGDALAALDMLGRDSRSAGPLSLILISEGKLIEAARVWDSLADADARSISSDSASQIISKLLEAKQYSLAARIDRKIRGVGSPEGLVSNGGFESPVKTTGAGPFDWQLSDGGEVQIRISTSEKRSGEQSLAFLFDNKRSTEFREVRQLIPVEPGAEYEFTVYYRSELRGASTVRWDIVNASTGGPIASTSAADPNADWAPLTIRFRTPSDLDGVMVKLVRDGCPTVFCPISGRLWFDDISVRKVS